MSKNQSGIQMNYLYFQFINTEQEVTICKRLFTVILLICHFSTCLLPPLYTFLNHWVKNERCLPKRRDVGGWAKKGKGEWEAQISSYKVNKSWGCNGQHENIISNIVIIYVVTDSYWTLSWWSLCEVYKCWIIKLYT